TAQKRVEAYNFEIRKHLLEYDDVMNKQREIIYSERRAILEGEDLKEVFFDMLNEVVDKAVGLYLSKEIDPEDWNWVGLESWLKQKVGQNAQVDRDKFSGLNENEIKEELIARIKDFYTEKEKNTGDDRMRALERAVMLHVIDSRWKEHLYSLDYLKEGIGLRAYAARDPLIEYQREAYQMFVEMMDRIKEEAVELILRMQLVEEKEVKGVFSSLPQKTEHREFTGLSKEAAHAAKAKESGQEAVLEEPEAEQVKRQGPKVGRNDPCPCGSGKKYKKCCGQ
ncbi:MAG TPA: SEC-C metal-binding domain-containing protein, partial [Candidatus Omnitrophota bacterium]|nr:SEC-C metal-binding domain-containing protein [Candidatus Omnitrophota bacterium]